MTTEKHGTAEAADILENALPHSFATPEKTLDLAKQANSEEHSLTLRDALRQYPRAVLWSALLSTSIIMEGYDLVLMSSFFAQPAFSEHFGVYDPGTGKYQITASWQNGLSNAVSVGTMVGAFANGYFTHKFGYRKVLLASLCLITTFIFIPFFAVNLPMLLVGEFLCGVPWGVFATMATAYASEICPMALRGHLTVYVNLCWAFGQLISAGVQAGFSENPTEWAYRTPFAIQWAWPIPLFAIHWFAPESPWYYVRINRPDLAEESLVRLGSAGRTRTKTSAREAVAMMIHTNELEKRVGEGTSYLDCFRGIDRRRTEIACMVFAAQPFCGSSMGGTPTYFFVQAGLPSTISFQMSCGGLGLAALGTIVVWWLMQHFGRRTLYLWGLGLLTAILMVVGFISVGTGAGSAAGNYAQATMMLLWLFVYYLTVGPICYAIIGETSSIRLRTKSVCLSRIVYYAAQIVCNVVNPYMLNPTAGDWKGKTGFFWGGMAFLFFVWTYFRLPEMRGKTFEELDVLFARGVRTRDFAGYRVDAYAEGDGALRKAK
ncbi:Maltose permease MAL31 [Apiospora phragmitis]|uniref:Maltose permease MAL31 n=1 Tax=Apiospora phragmitis TaxID=2905665 RepID=A0ABR1WSX3_9PEZI